MLTCHYHDYGSGFWFMKVYSVVGKIHFYQQMTNQKECLIYPVFLTFREG